MILPIDLEPATMFYYQALSSSAQDRQAPEDGKHEQDTKNDAKGLTEN